MITEHRRLQQREYGRKRRLLHHDDVLAYQREWQRDNRDKTRAYDLRWRESSPDIAKASDTKKYKKHHQKLQESSPEYRAKNVERVKLLSYAVCQRRRARMHGSYIGPVSLNQLLANSHGFCGICKKDMWGEPIEFDHIIPIAKGGSHTQDNLQASHRTCNRHKSAKLLSELTNV